jgi:acylphosphatase
MSVTKRVHVYVSGQVQGVFYRSECRRKAQELGVAGFVRNLPDGRVEAAFEGEDPDVDAMVSWCQEGTPYADVRSVQAIDEDPKGEGDFRVRS